MQFDIVPIIATGAVDSGDLRISPQISKKFEMILMLFLWAWRKMIHEKNLK